MSQSASLIQQLKSARGASVPLVAINTPDSAATIKSVCEGVNGDSPKIQWDLIRGMIGLNKAGSDWVATLGEDDPTKMSPVAAMMTAVDLPESALLFIHLTNRWIVEPPVIQAVWNLRDLFKANHRMLVLLAKHCDLPAELSEDVVVFDEPLPTGEQLREIVAARYEEANVSLADNSEPQLVLDDGTACRAVEALRGLPAFAAEQITAMSLRRSGVNVDQLWERKRQQIEQTPGLKVFRDGERFDSIGGCEVVKSFLSRVMQGEGRPNCVVFVDEIEKSLAGTKGDTSGVTQDQLGALLSYMQDHQSAGMIFIGPPGAAKSAIAKAAGNEGGVPTIQLDLGAAKGSLVGQSEQQLRQALKVITAVSNGKSLWIATCNSIADLPPELRRRFTLGTFFFDLPTADERNAIWSIWAQRYGIEMFRSGKNGVQVINGPPNDEGWTGAEIRQACDIAWRLGCSLKEAASFVVPVSKSAADAIKKLRDQASNRFLSASYPGVYTAAGPERAESAPGTRKLTLAE